MTDLDRPALREMMAKVMGWFHPTFSDGTLIETLWVSKQEEDSTIDPHETIIIPTENWKPDTDLNQAFMLSQKMAERGWRMFIVSPDIIEPDKTSVGFTKSSWPFNYLKDANPALAICLAIAEVVKETPPKPQE